MNKWLLMALVASGFVVSARADIGVGVSIRNQSAWLVDDNPILMTSAVFTAKRGMHTPTGHFKVSEKEASHISNIYHASMPFYMPLGERPFDMHAGYLPGYPASPEKRDHDKLTALISDPGSDLSNLKNDYNLRVAAQLDARLYSKSHERKEYGNDCLGIGLEHAVKHHLKGRAVDVYALAFDAACSAFFKK